MEIWIVIGLLAFVAGLVIVTYNRLVALRQTREQSFADIDVQLTQRSDLIPNLVETVKGYTAHEQTILENVTNARANIQSAKNTNERIEAETRLSGALMNLYAVAENYPDLKADGNFQKLMDELSDIENKLAAARRFFNNATSELNTAVEQFPAVLFAGALGFGKQPFFEVDEGARATLEKAPDVSFG